jgi:hypothetical protein
MCCQPWVVDLQEQAGIDDRWYSSCIASASAT